ncbi:hypothetical protein OBBRIDRAFT_839740 [Obba rivulosa]|uniref:Uncharacterized protein n=1 Tax=Obba rivulosa TaxID=1052685 RepID=A0A8E2DG19_9APHY|nr:hypothetical protein OBBRIDRAFT_839740 [Obba rivulosa]
MSTCESWGNPTPNLPYDLEWEGPARFDVSSASSRAAGRNSRSFTTGLRPTLAFAPYPPPTNLAFPSGYMETINLGTQGLSFKQYPPDFTQIPAAGYDIDSSNNTHLMGQDESVPPAEQRTIVLEEWSLSQLRDLKKNGGSSSSDANEYAPPTRGRKKSGERCLKCRDNHNGCIGNVGECCR